jgi:hypothetical protein
MKGKQLYYFVAGFVDGEGSFSISITRQKYKYNPLGWRWIINPVFQVYQHEDNIDMLELLRDYVFKTGRIHRKSSPYHVFTYSIENHKTLNEKIIPFFRKYRLATKDEDFEKFAEIIDRMVSKKHLSLRGFKQIVDIAFTMNAYGKQRKYSKEYIFKTLPKQFKHS